MSETPLLSAIFQNNWQTFIVVLLILTELYLCLFCVNAGLTAIRLTTWVVEYLKVLAELLYCIRLDCTCAPNKVASECKSLLLFNHLISLGTWLKYYVNVFI